MSYSVRNNRQFYVVNNEEASDIVKGLDNKEAYFLVTGADGVKERSQIIPADKVKSITVKAAEEFATKQKYYKISKISSTEATENVYFTNDYEKSLQIKFRHYIYDGDDSTLDFVTVANGATYFDIMAFELGNDIYRDSIFSDMIDVYVDSSATVKDKSGETISAATVAEVSASVISLKNMGSTIDSISNVSYIYIVPKAEKWDLARKNNNNSLVLDIIYKVTKIKEDDNGAFGVEKTLGEVDFGVLSKEKIFTNSKIFVGDFKYNDAIERIKDMEYYYTAERGDKYRLNMDYMKSLPKEYSINLTKAYSVIDITFSRHDFRESMEQPQMITIAVQEGDKTETDIMEATTKGAAVVTALKSKLGLS